MLPDIHADQKLPVELYGQFHVQMGQLDRVYTIWRHSGGYGDVDKTQIQLAKMMDYQEFVKQQGKLLQKREQQLCYEFAFWPTYDDYFDGGIFEIRSYSLKVGKAFHLSFLALAVVMSSFLCSSIKIIYFITQFFCYLHQGDLFAGVG